MATPVLVWFRQDLRLSDQPALSCAAQEGPVIPVYILDDDAPGDWRMGGAQRWWLHHSLESLAGDLADKGSRLILRRGSAVDALTTLMAATGARHIHAIHHYEPWWIAAEQALGDSIVLHDGNHLARLEEVTTGSGGQYKVYSSFAKALAGHLPPDDPWDAPHEIPVPDRWPESENLADWALLPDRPNWAAGFDDAWQPGEHGADLALRRFERRAADYEERRNNPSVEGTSALSPHLHFGEISVRRVWHHIDGRGKGEQTFRAELAWRDFTDGVVLARPDYGRANGRSRYDRLEWRTGAAADDDLRAWQQGRTGYPIVDAGMRQLWAIGWMHNRVRMIVASFLTKHLLIDWRAGERWFWDTLVDADYGNNSVNWQWVSGTGVDANMWGRVMAPLSQSEKFDAGDYIRQWVPELAHLGDDAIHDPEAAGCWPDDYPEKRISHKEGRERAIAAGRAVR